MFDKFFGGVNKHFHQYGRNYLTAGAVIFAGVEGVLAYKAGKKEGQDPSKTPQEWFKRIAGAAGSFALSATCAITGNAKAGEQIALLVAGNMLDKKKRQEFVNEVKETIGEEALDDIKKKIHGNVVIKEEEKVSGKVLIVDDVSGARNWSTKEEFFEKLLCLNENYMSPWSRGYLSHREVLEKLGWSKESIPTDPIYTESDGTQVRIDDIGYNSYTLAEDYEMTMINARLIEGNDGNNNKYYLVDWIVDPWVGYLND